MQVKLKKKDLLKGVEIYIPGVLANPVDDPKDPNPIYIESYKGKILVHIWNGEQDPATIELKQKKNNYEK